MRALLYLSVLGTLAAVPAQSQTPASSLYMPRNVRNAVEKGTRSLDGFPGKNYWQNFGRYDITVTALPPDRRISGSEQITYFNRSPDTLHYLVFKLIQNIHIAGAIRFGDQDSTYFTSGVHIDSFLVNGLSQPWRSSRAHYTWQEQPLSSPMLPGDSVRLNITWHYEISLKSGREGMIDSTSYYLAYFYPRVAVYDDYYGWDRLNFTDAQEFYNDFNDYDLKVRVPANFFVWATGDLLNPSEVLRPEYLRRYENSLTSDDVIHIAGPSDLASRQVTQPNSVNTWHFAARDITDVALGLSDHYDWDASSVVVDDATGRRASVQSGYLESALDFHDEVAIGRYTLAWFSHNWPGVPYPFSKSSVFQGFADMEYPMMVNDASSKNLYFSRLVENHEIAHSYFPFYMGINETRYPFMDEGWATTLELLIGRSESTRDSADMFYRNFRVNRWARDPSAEEDLPIITPGSSMFGLGYGINAYGKPSMAYLALKDMLGDQLFKKALHAYMDRWHGKHPIPWDFFNSMSNASGMDLNWFWTDWFFSNNYTDLVVGAPKLTGGSWEVPVNNIGGFAVPFDLITRYAGGILDSTHFTPALWKKDLRHATLRLRSARKPESVSLDMGIFVDADRSNNVWPRK